MPRLYVTYETFCVNCQEKGYSFGYTLKTIEYKGYPVLDSPSSMLNGMFVSFSYNGQIIKIKNLENAHSNTDEAEKPIFRMINAKHGQGVNQISRFTYQYLIKNNPALILTKEDQALEEPQIMVFLDSYIFRNQSYILLFYSFKNKTHTPLYNLNFFQAFDFDIYGEEHYKTDYAQFDAEQNIVYQYDYSIGRKKSLYAALGGSSTLPPSYFDATTPPLLKQSIENFNLSNSPSCGPGDCAVALQWTLPFLYPNDFEVFPIMIVIAEGEEEFHSLIKKARNHLEKLEPTIPNVIHDKFRQRKDPHLEKMSFSMRQWCTPK